MFNKKKALANTTSNKKENTLEELRISKLRMYATLLKFIITKGNKEPEKELAVDEVRFGVSTIYTASKISKVLFVQEIPVAISNDWKSDVRDIISEFHGVKVIFYDYYEPFNIRKNQNLIKHRLNIWAKRYDEWQEKESAKSEGERVKDSSFAAKDINSNDRMIESYKYITQAIEDKREFMYAKYVVKLVGEDRIQLQKALTAVKSYFFYSDIKTYQVVGYVKEFLKSFGLGYMSPDKTIIQDSTNQFIIDDYIAGNFSTYSQGYVPSKGLYIGNDYFNNIPTFRELVYGTDAANYLIAAGTGSGKSSFIRNLMAFSLLHKNNVILIDFEGDEYIAYGKFLGAKFVSFSSGTYFDTLEISELTTDDDINAELKNQAVGLTAKIMGLLISEEGFTSEERAVFNDLINAVYISAGVTEDENTWHKSKGLSFKHIYLQLIKQSKSETFSAKYATAINSLLNGWRVFFGEDALFKSKFRTPVSVNELKGSRFVIFLFGEKGSTTNVASNLDIQLKQLYVASISTILTNHWYFQQGKRTYKIYEEGQRYWAVPTSPAIIQNDWTGGRKRGLVNFFITNDPLQMEKTDSEFGTGIMDNFTGAFIGSLGSKDAINYLVNKFNLENSVDLLYQLMTKDVPKLKYHFVGIIKGSYATLTKVTYPKFIMDSPIFKTGGDKNKEEGA